MDRRRFVKLAGGVAGLAGTGALGALLEACGGEATQPAAYASNPRSSPATRPER